MYAQIKIIDKGIISNFEWEDTDQLSMLDYIKESCYGVVENGGKALVLAELYQPLPRDREYGNNIPDDFRYADNAKFVDALTFLYDDNKGTLDLVTAHNTYKAL